MQLFNLLFTIALFFLPILAVPKPGGSHPFTYTVKYSNQYDQTDASLVAVACSNGYNGLMSQGFTTLGSLPSFPFIGGADAVSGWNSAECGTCWRLTYKGNSITMLAVDHTADGFMLSQEAMDALTGGQAVDLGHIKTLVTKVSISLCGL